MPPRKKSKGAAKLRRDRLGALPDDALRHVLSFLPAQDAVQTCVLARRWRHLWKSTTGLRITCRDYKELASMKKFPEFVNSLLLLRGGLPLDTCEITLFEFDDDYDMPRVNIWIRHVLLCKVRVLRLCTVSIREVDLDHTLQLDQLPLVSKHLTRLEFSCLSCLQLSDSILDFSSCPVLEDLEFDGCDFTNADRILAPSLKRLSTSSSCEFGEHSRTHVYAPNLVSLNLKFGYGRAPVLQRMPSLVQAVVSLDSCAQDWCDNSEFGDCDNDKCSRCYEIDSDTNSSVLLQGLSEAKSLELISDVELFVFRRDLKWCPTFSNLKTLLLNEHWCVPADFSALACILEHSPVLEKLTLQLFCKGPKSKVIMKGCPDPTRTTVAISEHLKVVEVKCEVVDETILNVFKFLKKLNIYSYNTCFSFEE